MRTGIWLAGVVASLMLAAPVRAQVNTFGGANLTTAQNVVVDTGQGASSGNLFSSFSLTGLLNSISLPGTKHVVGRSVLPPPQAMPGLDYMKQFGYRRPTMVSPP
jgi:hypothetical protein